MAAPRTSHAGGRAWTTVVGLGAVLACVAALQLPAAFAGAPARAGTAASALPSTATSDLDAAERVPARRVGFPTPAVVAAAPVAVVRAAVAPAPVGAPAPSPDLCSGAGWEQRRGEAALASLKGDASRTGFAVTFESARSGYLGLTHLDEKRIAMHVRSCAKESDELLRHVMAHELGHAWDTSTMSGTSRAAYLAARGIPAGTPWYGCSGCTDFATPAGDFAEVYAQWSRGADTNRSLVAGDASPAQLSALAAQFFGA
ncbi:MAG: hypothetical protein JWN88_2706 [Frankiales bacterium]|jgi:hypothetical protein|nr:hypothetical protein [Frankiales bacterium]